MRQHVTFRDHLTASMRECWVLASNKRLSAEVRNWTSEPALHALVIESITVDEDHRRQGLCRDFIAQVVADQRFELVVVEGVQNPHLAAALERWGWELDDEVMDFYKIAPTDREPEGAGMGGTNKQETNHEKRTRKAFPDGVAGQTQ